MRIMLQSRKRKHSSLNMQQSHWDILSQWNLIRWCNMETNFYVPRREYIAVLQNEVETLKRYYYKPKEEGMANCKCVYPGNKSFLYCSLFACNKVNKDCADLLKSINSARKNNFKSTNT